MQRIIYVEADAKLADAIVSHASLDMTHFLRCSRKKELFANVLHSPQAHPAQSNLVLQFRKECFYFPALALRDLSTSLAKSAASSLF